MPPDTGKTQHSHKTLSVTENHILQLFFKGVQCRQPYYIVEDGIPGFGS